MIRTSVIIPVYNTAEYLRECLDSVLDQKQKDIEIILVDDGSDDGSLEIEEEYAANYPFIRLLRQDHEYQGTARNRGLEIAQGEFVYFMDSDDVMAKNAVGIKLTKSQQKLFDEAISSGSRDGLDISGIHDIDVEKEIVK